jgi:hypothetical protein
VKLKRTLLIGLGIILFAGGNILNIFVSSSLLWGEMEAGLFIPRIGDKNLKLECPLMLAPWETAAIRTVVTNSLMDEAVKPQVSATISHDGARREVSETLELSASESQSLQWTVDKADIVFGRLILVSVLQRPYRSLPSRQGTCSIYVYGLYGLNGRNTLALLLGAGIFTSLAGLGSLAYFFRPPSARLIKVLQVNLVFLLLVLAGVVTAVTRLWGLTLVFNAGALLVITVASVEVFFSPKK